MALLFVDSCDHQTAALITANGKWDVDTQGTTKYQAVAARDGNAGIDLTTAAAGNYIQKNIPARTTLFARYAIKVPVAIAVAPTKVFSFIDIATQQVGINIQPDGHFQAVRFSQAQLIGGPSVAAMSFGSWHFLECKVVIDSVNGVVILKLDGVTILNLTNVNTQSTANNTAGAFAIGGFFGAGVDGAPAFYVDSFTMNDDNVTTLGGLPALATGFFGDTICQCVFTRANGTLNQWTRGGTDTGANFSQVNENPPDGNVTYVKDSTPTDQDRYLFQPVSGVSVVGLSVTMIAQKDDASARSIRAVTKSGATVADNGIDFPLVQNNYGCFEGFFEVDPNTAAAWTPANINLAEFGEKVTV